MVTSAPKAAWIRTRLLNLIDTLPVDTALPSERQLAHDLQVARMTLRRAMDELVYEGLLVRRHGSGVYTARPKVAGRLAVTSFTEDMLRRGITPGTEVLSFRRGRADGNVARLLRIPVNDPAYFYCRLRLADGVPMGVDRGVVVAELVPNLTASDAEGSLYVNLLERHGVRVTGATLNLEAVLPDHYAAQRLGIAESQPCIQISGIGIDAGGRVVEIGRNLYRGDRYQLGSSLGTFSAG
ncbi:GntR family transcriptional regulator [Flindersiella endophytica]